MARGFESKSVEFQQEEAARRTPPSRPAMTPAALANEERRRTLQLALNRTADDLSRATAPAHRRMLEQATEALKTQLRELDTP